MPGNGRNGCTCMVWFEGLSYVVRLNDLRTAQHFRARLTGVLRRPHNLAKPLHDDLKDLLEISGLWVRNVGNRHDIKLQIAVRS